ncbi:hypothetical protein CMI45_02630 [Candidatus Pacearchaeota archaeon]|nr:hypothetical protein [Candidatus Pacearchaeota archaeon]|tara:strand:- start:3665 stop:4258 length:594 start_codon:yes stop_codon:yes gene_type:complete
MTKRKKGRNVKNESWQKESWNYLKESKNYVYAVALVFVASSVLGFVFSSELGFFDELLKELIDKTEGLNAGEMIWFIFTNNVTSSFLALILGVFLGIFSIFNSLFNGLLLGYVYFKASEVAGYGIFWKLVPHGIFELPAIFISLGLGVKFGMFLFAKDKKRTFIERLKKSMKVFVTIVLPLLVIAAVIEGLLIVYAG